MSRYDWQRLRDLLVAAHAGDFDDARIPQTGEEAMTDHESWPPMPRPAPKHPKPPHQESVDAAKAANVHERAEAVSQLRQMGAEQTADMLTVLTLVDRYGPERIAKWVQAYKEAAADIVNRNQFFDRR